jgi:MFS family permease
MDQSVFKRATFAVILCSSYPMLIVGCYFGLIPWNMERLQIDESDLGFAILTFGVSFLISNQIAGRILVPKFGTKKIMSIGIVIISLSNIILVSAPEYYILLLSHIPAGIGWGSSGPIGGIHAQLIEKHSGKIISPYYAMGFNIGIFVGGILAGFILGNEMNPTFVFSILFFISIFVSSVVYINGLPNDLDFKGKGEKLKLPEKNVLIFGFLLFVIFGSIVLFSSIVIGNFYFILITFLIYGFLTANLVPIIIRQAVKYSSESIPTTVTNLITMGFSALLFAPAIIGFVAETFSLTINMYALCIIVFLLEIFFLENLDKL